MAILTWLGVPGDAKAWESLGFNVADGECVVGHVIQRTAEPPAWGFDTLHAEPDIWIPTGIAPRVTEPGSHPNGIDKIDHIVYAVPKLDPAVETLTDILGEPPRRRAFPRGESGPEMAFFRVGEPFIEVVESGEEPAALLGIAYSSPDLDATVAAIRAAGGPVGDPKPAIQGGRIASVWKGHMNWGIAIMEPPPKD